MNDQTSDTAEQSRQADYAGVVKAGWICFLVTVVAAFIPFLGLLAIGPLGFATLVLAIVALVKGATGHGIALMLCALLALPIIVFVVTSGTILGTFLAAMPSA